MNATVEVTADGATVWAPVQGPQMAQIVLAQVLKIPPAKVTVIPNGSDPRDLEPVARVERSETREGCRTERSPDFAELTLGLAEGETRGLNPATAPALPPADASSKIVMWWPR